MLFCDPYHHERPRLRFVTLPVGCQIGNGPRDAKLMDQHRLVRPSQGRLRYIEIDYNRAAVCMWTLVHPKAADPWRREYQVSFTDMWAHHTYIATGLPQGEVPKLALIDPNNHKIIYFFQDALLFAWDAGKGEVVCCEECFLDRDSQNLTFQYSRFIDAWESELAPTLHGDDGASSDGGTGMSETDEEEKVVEDEEHNSSDEAEKHFDLDPETEALKLEFLEAAARGRKRPCVQCFKDLWKLCHQGRHKWAKASTFYFASFLPHYASCHRQFVEKHKNKVQCSVYGNWFSNSAECEKHKNALGKRH
ncbi:unnamed protein product [Urochloa humidicola]